MGFDCGRCLQMPVDTMVPLAAVPCSVYFDSRLVPPVGVPRCCRTCPSEGPVCSRRDLATGQAEESICVSTHLFSFGQGTASVNCSASFDITFSYSHGRGAPPLSCQSRIALTPNGLVLYSSRRSEFFVPEGNLRVNVEPFPTLLAHSMVP